MTFSFAGSSHRAVAMQGVNMDGSLDLDPGEKAFWSNGRVDVDPDPDVDDFVNHAVLLADPAPAKVKVDVTCEDFSDPVLDAGRAQGEGRPRLRGADDRPGGERRQQH